MRRSILHRRKKLKIKKQFELQLTSMMDMLIIILVFLLKSYQTTTVNLTASDKIKLPYSTTENMPEDALNLIIEPSGIVFDNSKIVDFIRPAGLATDAEVKPDVATYELQPNMLGDGGRKILPLYDAMVKARDNAEQLMSKAQWVVTKDGKKEPVTEPPKFQGILTIQADKAVRYDVLKRVMYTAGAAQYKVFKFITVKKEI